jgi:cell division protein FtsB
MNLKKGRTVFLAGFLALIVVWMIVFGGRIADLNRLTDEFNQSQLTISALTATTRALATEIVRADSDAAVEEWAYEQAKMIREGDHRVAVVPVDGTPIAPTPLPTPVPQPQNLFRIWWQLFFDTKP